MKNEQIQIILNEILRRGQGTKDKYRFVKHYNELKISPEFVKDIISKHNYYFFTHEFRNDVMQTVYEPFFEWTKELIDCRGDMEVREFLNECDVYPLQLDLIENFYYTGKCERNEDILLHEFGYETNRMMDNMIHIFRKISQKQPIFILLNGIHYAHSSTLRFLQYMIEHLADSEVYILGVYNGELGTDTYICSRVGKV